MVSRGIGPELATAETGRAGRTGVEPMRALFIPGLAALGASRSMVAKAPHRGHRPAQRTVVASHAVHRYVVVARAMAQTLAPWADALLRVGGMRGDAQTGRSAHLLQLAARFGNQDVPFGPDQGDELVLC